MGQNYLPQDYSPPSVGAQTRDSLRALANWGPGAISSLGGAIRQQAPIDAASQAALYQQFGPQFFGIGEDLSDIQAQRGVQRDMSTIQGGGLDLARQALSLDREANPEFYANRAVAGQGFQSLIGGQDPNRLTGGEMANVERGINRMNQSRGNPANIGDATTTASNAMLFGDKLNQKRNQFAQSLALFPGIQQGSNSNIDAYQVASGRGATGSNASLNRYQQPQTGDANSLYGGITQGVFGSQQQAQDINADRRGIHERFLGPINCCFIFLEAYNGQLPESVRLCRDIHYQQDHSLSTGYKRMAKWLVPLMRRSRVVTALVNQFMVRPITRYGEWLVGNDHDFWPWDRAIRNGWFAVWRKYGKA